MYHNFKVNKYIPMKPYKYKKYVTDQNREFDSFIYQNNLAGLIKPTFFMSIF